MPGAGRMKAFPKLKRTDWFGVVTPIRPPALTAGKPVVVGHDPLMGNESPDAVVFSPHGATGYAIYPGTNTIVLFRTATGRAGRPIRVGYYPLGAVVTPDGRWVYLSEATGVAAIRTSTRTVTRIKAGPGPLVPLYDGASVIGLSPDGKTVYALNYRVSASGTVTPISVATSRPGKPITVGVNPVTMIIVR